MTACYCYSLFRLANCRWQYLLTVLNLYCQSWDFFDLLDANCLCCEFVLKLNVLLCGVCYKRLSSVWTASYPAIGRFFNFRPSTWLRHSLLKTDFVTVTTSSSRLDQNYALATIWHFVDWILEEKAETDIWVKQTFSSNSTNSTNNVST